MSDLIERQAAIDAIAKYLGRLQPPNTWKTWRSIGKVILDIVPSAQPTYTDAEIQKMQDLESAEIEKAYQLGYEEGKKDAQSEKVQLSEEDVTKDTTYDCISRQEAIDAIDELDWYHHGIKEMVKGANPAEHQAWYKADDVYKALDSLPSAEPKAYTVPHKGEWIEIRRKKNDAVIALRCNQCLRYPKRAVRTDFCPNCGADMRQSERNGEQDDS